MKIQYIYLFFIIITCLVGFSISIFSSTNDINIESYIAQIQRLEQRNNILQEKIQCLEINHQTLQTEIKKLQDQILILETHSQELWIQEFIELTDTQKLAICKIYQINRAEYKHLSDMQYNLYIRTQIEKCLTIEQCILYEQELNKRDKVF